MNWHEHNLELKTTQPLEIIDISQQVEAFVTEHEIQQGILHLGTLHTTMGLAINEHCEKLAEDMRDFLSRLAPPQAPYRHNRVAVDGRPNAHSHLLSLVLQNQLSLIVKQGAIQLGQWQSLFAIELDGPRESRKINLTLMGD